MVTFRKSKKLGPFRVTLSPRGVSASAGMPGLRVSANSRGEVRRTLGIPGTGVYDTKRVNGRTRGGRTARPEPVDLDAVAADLILNLPPEDQGKAYALYRADPADTLEKMRHDLLELGMARDMVEDLMPALRRYMDRWMLA